MEHIIVRGADVVQATDGLKKDQGPEKFVSAFMVKVIVILKLECA